MYATHLLRMTSFGPARWPWWTRCAPASTDVLRAVWPVGLDGARGYYDAHILALLGRRDEAVAWLRQALNHGWRLVPDEALQWYWEPISDYPPFQELVRVRG